MAIHYCIRATQGKVPITKRKNNHIEVNPGNISPDQLTCPILRDLAIYKRASNS